MGLSWSSSFCECVPGKLSPGNSKPVPHKFPHQLTTYFNKEHIFIIKIIKITVKKTNKKTTGTNLGRSHGYNQQRCKQSPREGHHKKGRPGGVWVGRQRDVEQGRGVTVSGDEWWEGRRHSANKGHFFYSSLGITTSVCSSVKWDLS